MLTSDNSKKIAVLYDHIKFGNNKNLSLMSILKKKSIFINAECGGNGICGKCKIKASGSISKISEDELKILNKDEINEGIRLACKTKIEGNFSFEVLNKRETLKNCKTEISATINFTINPRIKGRGNEQIFGIAVDLGTTTVACYLINMISGKLIDSYAFKNPQSVYGSDLISRINFSLTEKEGIKKIQNCIIETLNSAILYLSSQNNIDTKNMYECIIVGNSVMNHFFLGLSTKTLSEMPFSPLTMKRITLSPVESLITNINTAGKITFLDNLGGFVGSDILACLIITEIKNKDKQGNYLLIDLGTNGEIAVVTKETILVCSTAAGPAFEGACISKGMQSFPGAINSFKMNDKLSYTTIDNIEPKGICGSGLIDIISILKQHNVIDLSGNINEPSQITNHDLKKRINGTCGEKSFFITDSCENNINQKITITQKDIREIQLAKSAVHTAIKILLQTSGLNFNAIDKIYIAGAFGSYINIENAIQIGLIPSEIEINKIEQIGNAAGNGAIAYLLDKNLSDMTDDIFKRTKHIEIAENLNFQNEFIDGLYF